MTLTCDHVSALMNPDSSISARSLTPLPTASPQGCGQLTSQGRTPRCRKQLRSRLLISGLKP